jgi:hypothetical protein
VVERGARRPTAERMAGMEQRRGTEQAVKPRGGAAVVVPRRRNSSCESDQADRERQAVAGPVKRSGLRSGGEAGHGDGIQAQGRRSGSSTAVTQLLPPLAVD